MSSRPFDPHWTTELASLQTHLSNLCKRVSLVASSKRKRNERAQGNYEAAIKAIVLDLYRAHECDAVLEVGIPTGQTTLQKRCASRYGVDLLAPRTFRAALADLISCNYVIKTTPHWDDPSGKSSRTARYQASPSLLEGIINVGGSIVALTRQKCAEGIRLKDEKKRLVEYGSIRFANDARVRLMVINDMLHRHWADLALTDQQLFEEKTKIAGDPVSEAAQPFDFAARAVYRVFNNNDWNEGGRFYGPWWMSCPSRLRRHILIDGKRTVEVDYSGLHAAILYAESGLSIPDDPYQRCLTKAGNHTERKLVKRTFNALLNASSVAGIGEIAGYSVDITGREWRDFKLYIISQYPEFESLFGTGVGLRLQRRDSDLAEAVMLKFAAQGYACLPVHDSFIVHHELKDELTDAMQGVFEDEFGASGKVNYEIGIGEPIATTAEPIQPDFEGLLNLNGYHARLNTFWAIQHT